MNQQQFQSWLEVSQIDVFQPNEGTHSTLEHPSPTPDQHSPHSDPLRPTKFLCQLPLSGSTLKARRKKHAWTASENRRMLELHDELGNRWSTLSKKMPEKSENDIKNHFFSQLRMSLRCLNKLLAKPHLKKQQSIKPIILYKISNVCEEQFNKETSVGEDLIQQAIRIKQNLFNFLDYPEEEKKQLYLALVKELKLFTAKTNKGSKGRGKSKTEDSFFQDCPDRQAPSDCDFPGSNSDNNMESLREDREVSEEIKSEIIRPEDSTELIARPSFCLQNPFQQIQAEFQEEEASWCNQMRPFEFNYQPEVDSWLSQFLSPYEFKSFEL